MAWDKLNISVPFRFEFHSVAVWRNDLAVFIAQVVVSPAVVKIANILCCINYATCTDWLDVGST